MTFFYEPDEDLAGFFDQIGETSHVVGDVFLDVPPKVPKPAFQIVQNLFVGQVFQVNDIGVRHTVAFDDPKKVLHFAPGIGTVISGMLGPFVQLEVHGVSNLIAAHTGYGLD
tara:strand:- start:601 stop:936 length:336 start_codon:yes stop_codon:yes gene_type:complete